MSFTKNTALALTAFASLGLAAHPASAGTPGSSIGIHFQGSTGSLVQNGAGAVVTTATWNNFSGQSSTGSTDDITYNNPNPNSSLENNAGTATGTTITFNAASIYRSGSPNTGGNDSLMNGYLDTNNTDPTTATINGITYSTYDVYVYALGDTSNRGASYTIGNTTYYLNSDDPTFGDGFKQVTNTSSTISAGGIYSGTNATGNYMEFMGLTGGSFTLTATPTYQNGSAARAPLNGIQIVDASPAAVPEASSLVSFGLLLAGAGGLILAARKRTTIRDCK